ncbi:MAG: hypothetical protein WCO56_17975 [Verrucomicrobiota bacterium]
MNREEQIRVMAYLDGELTPAESKQVELWLATSPDGQGLAAELRLTREALRGNETSVKVPESPEFYWSKIQQAIEREERQTVPVSQPWWVMLRRYLKPISGFALFMLLAMGSTEFWMTGARYEAVEVENMSEHTQSLSFHNQAERMSVVWIVNRDTEEAESADPEDEMTNE